MKLIVRPAMLIAMLRNVVASLLVACLLTACVVPHHSVVIESTPGPQTDARGVPVHASGPMTDSHYTVVRGDTLYSIAFRAGVDFRDLARWNGIPAPYVIHPGRRLRLTSPPRVAGVPSRPVFQPVTPPSSAKPPVPHPPTHAAVPATPAPEAARAVSTTIPVAGEVTPPDRAPVSAAAVPSAPSRSTGGVAWRWPADGAIINAFNPSDPIPGIEIAGKAGDPVRAAADGVVVYSGNGLVGYGELIIIKHNDTYLSAYGHNRKRLVREGERVRAGQVIAEMGSTGASRNELEFQVRKDGKPVDPTHYLPSR
ncbi:peptidoglycan DD-metalloendopeptidase family protein [Oleiagrimonas soli]|uniref:Lipoprotein NlpD n=1 Tax=Oleiagrimonas soli TaxID=1543381 RepID=A0A099CUC1_9GAMM|nr:peptidoglycan DD-metalloendopeptidase family protein [Oleiagrimonas soli]KGI77508.1 hypothetical protein LF63_0109225 [Oleiagrimonas soli]MBB6183024.1 lipoprotein NlpD [Oleiagrimonas soli]